jgi:cytochrome c5
MADVHIADHQSLIKTPKQLAVVMLAAFLVPVLGIVMVVHLITGGMDVPTGTAAMSEDAVARRLKPVGEIATPGSEPATQVATAPTPPGGAPTGAAKQGAGKPGEALYNTVCQACHATGAVGAPKTGDKAAWKPRLAQGVGTLHEHAIKGKGAMPPKGGAASASDADVAAAVDYMVSKSR